MNEWKELQIDNLPINPVTGKCDFVTGNYECEFQSSFNTTKFWKKSIYTGAEGRLKILEFLTCGFKYRYRKPEPVEDNKCRHRGSKIGSTYQCLRGNECLGVDYKCNIYELEEEKPLIVKSGGTWAAHWKGVDYLWTDQTEPRKDVTPTMLIEGSIWKPFSEIEKEGLTDEIALFRPMVCGGIQKYTLYGVLKEEGITWLLISDTLNDIEWYDNRLNDCRLATPHELQEQKS